MIAISRYTAALGPQSTVTGRFSTYSRTTDIWHGTVPADIDILITHVPHLGWDVNFS